MKVKPMNESLVLLVDDEPAITDSLAFTLKAGGFRSISAHSLQQASERLAESLAEISLVILDLTLPDGHGFDWLRQLRTHSQCPVIILSSHDDEIEHIVGLEIGADDYIDKPFSPREVVARVRAILRRIDHVSTAKGANTDRPSECPTMHLVLDRARYTVSYRGTVLNLSQLEHELLAYLIEHPELVHSRQALLREVWGGSVHVHERTIDVHIKGLRKRLAEVGAPDLIETVRGVGYRMIREF